MDANGVLAAVFDKANSRLSTTVVAGTSTARSEHAGNWALSDVYDAATGTLRVVAV